MMPTTTTKLRTVTLPRDSGPWPSTVVIACGSEAQLATYAARQDVDPELDMTDCMGLHVAHSRTVGTATHRYNHIFIKRVGAHAARVQILVHEAMHATADVLGHWSKMPLTEASEEAYCYYLDYLVRRGLAVL